MSVGFSIEISSTNHKQKFSLWKKFQLFLTVQQEEKKAFNGNGKFYTELDANKDELSEIHG